MAAGGSSSAAACGTSAQCSGGSMLVDAAAAGWAAAERSWSHRRAPAGGGGTHQSRNFPHASNAPCAPGARVRAPAASSCCTSCTRRCANQARAASERAADPRDPIRPLAARAAGRDHRAMQDNAQRLLQARWPSMDHCDRCWRARVRAAAWNTCCYRGNTRNKTRLFSRAWWCSGGLPPAWLGWCEQNIGNMSDAAGPLIPSSSGGLPARLRACAGEQSMHAEHGVNADAPV